MKKKGFSVGQIIGKLREAEILLSLGSPVGEVSCQVGGTEQTYYRWRWEYGEMRLDQIRRLKELDKENGRFKRLVPDLTLDNAILGGGGDMMFTIKPATPRRGPKRIEIDE